MGLHTGTCAYTSTQRLVLFPGRAYTPKLNLTAPLHRVSSPCHQCCPALPHNQPRSASPAAKGICSEGTTDSRGNELSTSLDALRKHARLHCCSFKPTCRLPPPEEPTAHPHLSRRGQHRLAIHRWLSHIVRQQFAERQEAAAELHAAAVRAVGAAAYAAVCCTAHCRAASCTSFCSAPCLATAASVAAATTAWAGLLTSRAALLAVSSSSSKGAAPQLQLQVMLLPIAQGLHICGSRAQKIVVRPKIIIVHPHRQRLNLGVPVTKQGGGGVLVGCSLDDPSRVGCSRRQQQAPHLTNRVQASCHSGFRLFRIVRVVKQLSPKLTTRYGSLVNGAGSAAGRLTARRTVTCRRPAIFERRNSLCVWRGQRTTCYQVAQRRHVSPLQTGLAVKQLTCPCSVYLRRRHGAAAGPAAPASRSCGRRGGGGWGQGKGRYAGFQRAYGNLHTSGIRCCKVFKPHPQCLAHHEHSRLKAGPCQSHTQLPVQVQRVAMDWRPCAAAATPAATAAAAAVVAATALVSPADGEARQHLTVSLAAAAGPLQRFEAGLPGAGN